MKIYLDNCCFNRPFDDQALIQNHLETVAKLSVQSSIADGNLELVWSYILEYENGQNPYSDRASTILEWREVAKVHVVESEEIVTRAESYMELGLKVKDALHVSCAIEAGAAFFLTTDKKLLNKTIEGISIVNPVDFVREED